MKVLMIEATEDSPYVLLDAKKCLMILKGRCIMGDPLPYQTAIMDWLRKYISISDKTLSVEIDLEYVTAINYQLFYNMIGELNKYYILGKRIDLIWTLCNEDQYLMDLIEIFKEEFEIPIKEVALV